MHTLVVIMLHASLTISSTHAVINGMKADIHDLGLMVHVNIVTELHACFKWRCDSLIVHAQNLVYKPDTLQHI